MRILLDIPRLVRMRSSECRTRKPRRMASRVWVVRVGEKGMHDRGSGTEQAVKGRWLYQRDTADGEEGRVDGEERMGRRVSRWCHAVENLPTVAAAMPLNRIHAILINRRRRVGPLARASTTFSFDLAIQPATI